MTFRDTPVAGACVIDPDPIGDDRGFFARLWSREEFAARGLRASFVQWNDAFTARRGTLRGLHYQAPPHQEAKLVRCVRGAVFDVIVDVRPDSPTCRAWFGQELSAENRRLLYVPEGCAHGYLALEDATEVLYATSAAYHPASERGIRWNDPAFAIAWPDAGPLTLSPKDRQWPDFVLELVS
jgi:dTDP-4-dehydrorhamnose 3,5-epimerase